MQSTYELSIALPNHDICTLRLRSLRSLGFVLMHRHLHMYWYSRVLHENYMRSWLFSPTVASLFRSQSWTTLPSRLPAQTTLTKYVPLLEPGPVLALVTPARWLFDNMSTKSTLVPSRNALRALRNLAYANPALFAGTVGSTCCLVAVNCEIQRRVGVAEQYVATKRTLRSVSNGEGASRVALLFEAAERGEDFTFGSRPSRRKRNIRHSSALAVERPAAEDLEHMMQTLADIPRHVEERRKRGKQGLAQSDANGSDAKVPAKILKMEHFKSLPAPHPVERDGPVYAPPLFKRCRRNTAGGLRDEKSQTDDLRLDFEREFERASERCNRLWKATLMPHKPQSHQVYGRRDSKSTQVPPDGYNQKPDEADVDFDKPRGLPSTHDLLRTAEETMSSRLLAEDVEIDAQWRNRKDRLPDENDDSDASHLGTTPRPDTVQDTDIAIIQQADASLWDFQAIRFFEQQYNLNFYGYDPNKAAFGDTDDVDIVNVPQVLHSRVSDLVAAGQISQAADYYLKHYHPDKYGLLPKIGALLVKRLGNCKAAFQILFPSQFSVKGGSTPGERQWLRASFYLFTYCLDSEDLLDAQRETRMWLQFARNEGVDLHSLALEPVTHKACSMGQTAAAENFIREMEQEFSLDSYRRLDHILAMSYARSRDWTSVNRIMSMFQEQGLPRERPAWFATAFAQLFDIHMRDHSLAQSYDYLIKAMGYWKLAPTERISTRLLAACVQARDYSLMHEWVGSVRALWPRFGIGTETKAFALALGVAWAGMEATCEDIEKGLRALAHGALSDPFGRSLRAEIRALVTRDLSRCLNAVLETRLDTSKNVLSQGDLGELPALLRTCETLVRRQDRGERVFSDGGVAAAELARQIQAFGRINQIMAGRAFHLPPVESDPDAGSGTIFHRKEIHARADLEQLQRRYPEILGATRLPAIDQLWPALSSTYIEAAKAGDPPPHDLLHGVIRRMTDEARLLEANKLLLSVAASPHVIGGHGKSLPERLYIDWLDITVRLSSPKSVTAGLWAIYDASRELYVSSHLLTHAAHVAARASKRTTRTNRLEDFKSREQLEKHYILDQLRKRAWIQNGKLKAAPRLREWQTWEEQIGLATSGPEFRTKRRQGIVNSEPDGIENFDV
jgi:hypothetical protein